MDKIFKYGFILICCFFLSNCNNDSLPVIIKDIKLKINRPFAMVPNSLSSTNNGTNLTIQNLEDQSISFIEFDSSGQYSTFSMTPDKFQRAHFFQVFIKAFDSIIIFNKQCNCIQIIDTNGVVSNEVPLQHGLPTTNPENGLYCYGNYIFLGNSDQNFNVGKQLERLNYYTSVQPVYQIDLKSDMNIKETVFGSFPTKYTKFNLDFCNYFPNICLYNASSVLLSFTSDDSIYVYENGVRINSFLCKSKYVDKFNSFSDQKRLDMAYYKKYLTTEPKYLNLIHDKYQNQFYRIVKHRFIYNAENQLDNDHLTWSIIVLNSNLKVVKELLFNYRFYSPEIIIPSINGIYISKTVTTLDNPKNLTLTLVKF